MRLFVLLHEGRIHGLLLLLCVIADVETVCISQLMFFTKEIFEFFLQTVGFGCVYVSFNAHDFIYMWAILVYVMRSFWCSLTLACWLAPLTDKLFQALSRFSVLQATESWAGPGNEARLDVVSSHLLYICIYIRHALIGIGSQHMCIGTGIVYMYTWSC